MPSTSKTGHTKNVVNFEDLISFCNGYGATYNNILGRNIFFQTLYNSYKLFCN